MKKTKIRLVGFMLSIAALGTCLIGCAKEEQPPQNVQTDQTQIAISAYEAQIEYYESLIQDLQNQLLNEKEENYIETCEYKLKIEALENSINVLSKKIGSISVSENSNFTDKKYESQFKDDENIPIIEEIVSKPDYTYSIQNGQVTITAYNGDELNTTVPSHIENLPVVSIGENAFKGSPVNSVTLPNSIRTIDWFAFADCAALTEITISSSVVSVGYGAFDRCSPSLTVICEKGSYIEAYALSWGIAVKSN